MNCSATSSTLELTSVSEKALHNNYCLNSAATKRPSGCYVTVTKCVIFAFLAVVAIVAVALIVFFASQHPDNGDGVIPRDIWPLCEGLTLARNICKRYQYYSLNNFNLVNSFPKTENT